jgi:hypothetical protein
MTRSLIPMAALLLLLASCSLQPAPSSDLAPGVGSTGRFETTAVESTGHLEATAVASTGALEPTLEPTPDPVPAP